MDRKVIYEIYENLKHMSYVKSAIDIGLEQGKTNDEIMATIIYWLHASIQQLQSDLTVAQAKKEGYI